MISQPLTTTEHYDRGYRDGLNKDCAASDYPQYLDGFYDGLRKAHPDMSEEEFAELYRFLSNPYRDMPQYD
ncbi:MAG: hypothetical protein M0R50_03335 [Candidatus Cloacimonetes bacterium]|jgi:hypothetical protein|nr:hypothetical protein [Candidatus Cloacimonadota bacterium]